MAAKLSYTFSIPVLITTGYSTKYGAHMGYVMRESLYKLYREEFNEEADFVAMHVADYAQDFNSLGEARAAWRRLLQVYGDEPETLETLHDVTRGVHSLRTQFLLWKQRPHQFRHVRIVRHQAHSVESGLWLHECKSWGKVLWQLVTGKLKPVE
jgi:hypothetical protein